MTRQTAKTIALLDETKQNLLANLRRVDDMVGTRIEVRRAQRIDHPRHRRPCSPQDRIRGPVAVSRAQANQSDPPELLRWSGETQTALTLMLATYGVERSPLIGAFRKQAADAIERADQLVDRIGLVGDADTMLHGCIARSTTASAGTKTSSPPATRCSDCNARSPACSPATNDLGSVRQRRFGRVRGDPARSRGEDSKLSRLSREIIDRR